MSDTDDWLPELVTLAAHNSDWEQYIEGVYTRFRREFVAFPPQLEGRRCVAGRDIGADGRELTFWHLITEGQQKRSEHQTCVVVSASAGRGR